MLKYVDFYCPSCGRAHTEVPVEGDEEGFMNFDVVCECGRKVIAYAAADWGYMSISADAPDSPTLVYDPKEVCLAAYIL